MYPKNKRSNLLVIAAMSGILMTGMASADELEVMVPSPELGFGLQAKVQTVLNQKIEQEIPTTLMEHNATAAFVQDLAISAEKKASSGPPFHNSGQS